MPVIWLPTWSSFFWWMKKRKIIINFLNSGTSRILKKKKRAVKEEREGGASQIKVQSKHMTFCFDVEIRGDDGAGGGGGGTPTSECVCLRVCVTDFCECVISHPRSLINAGWLSLSVCVYPRIVCCWLYFLICAFRVKDIIRKWLGVVPTELSLINAR